MKIFKNYKKWFILLWPFLFLQFSYAQETSGELSGRVTDPQQQGLAGATIEAVHVPSGTKYSLTTDKNGRYTINNMRIGGPYQLNIRLIGRKPETIENINIRLGAGQTLDFVLQPQDQQIDAVVIVARSQNQQADNFGSGKNIGKEQVRNMPSINRSITDLTRLVPQASKDNSFGGTNFRYNNVTIDGAINNDAIGFSPSLGGQTGTSGMAGSSTRTNPISIDAIQDIQVYLAPFDVKIGNFTGGSVNAVTRSGTNVLEGSVYTFGRNAALTSKDRVGTLGKMNDNFYDFQAGFRIGFPIIKNKLFFFSNEEITRRKDPTQLNVGNLEVSHILTETDAENIRKSVIARYGESFDPGTPNVFNNWSKSIKFFNRIDWNINDKHQFVLRNNTIFSKAANMDRDQQDFRFSSMLYQQTNNQSSTVAELKSRFNNEWSSNIVVGYTFVKDKRDPSSNAALPQVQIQGNTPGTTIYLGTDREASIFDMHQKTWEITANVNWIKEKHKFLFGTHNELYSIKYGFVNSWNGRVDYNSITDFINNRPYRVRGNYNYLDNTRDYILDHPAANFQVNMYSLYVQDEISINDRLKITPGLRADFSQLPNMPNLSDKLKNIAQDPYYGTTYFYTPLNKIENRFLNKVQISPRIGFRWDALADKSLILRGGMGVFTGRIPFAWLAYAYYNTGDSYGAFDQKADQKPFVPGSDAIKPSNNGIADFIAQNGSDVHDPNSGKTQVDLVDNGFTLPQVLRSSLAIDYTNTNKWKFSLEGIYTKNLSDINFQQLNIKDNPTWNGYDKSNQQPIYAGSVDSRFSNIYLLSNTNQGYRYSLTGSISKNFDNGLQLSVNYTYAKSKDISNGVRNSMESNWQLNQSLIPNQPKLAYSNFDIRHRIVSTISYAHQWKTVGKTSINLFFSAQSGSPFTYGIVNNNIQGLPQQVSLVYIPTSEEAINYFKDIPGGKTAIDQANSFNAFINSNDYLNSRRGKFTERNMGRTPWNFQSDLRISHEFHLKNSKNNFMISADVINITNLLSKSWGVQYFSPNTFNSTSSVGLTPALFPSQQNPGNWPIFTFNDPGKPYSIDYFNSRAQMQLGIRYSF